MNLETHDIERMVSEEVPKEYEKLLFPKREKTRFYIKFDFFR